MHHTNIIALRVLPGRPAETVSLASRVKMFYTLYVLCLPEKLKHSNSAARSKAAPGFARSENACLFRLEGLEHTSKLHIWSLAELFQDLLHEEMQTNTTVHY